MKMKDTFIDPLLHPYSTVTSPVNSPTPMDNDERSYMYNYTRMESPRESLDKLPIASRFLSPTPGLRSETPATVIVHAPSVKDGTPNIDGESLDTDDEEANDQVGKSYNQGGQRRLTGSVVAAAVAKFNHPRSPYNSTDQRNGSSKGGDKLAALPFPSRSHQSLPPPPRGDSTASLGRQSVMGMPSDRERSHIHPVSSLTSDRKNTDTPSSKVLKKLRRVTPPPGMFPSDAVSPHQLPEDLRKCLEVIESGIYNGHVTLSEGLRRRYEEQYPLVRSLADVFVNNVSTCYTHFVYSLILMPSLFRSRTSYTSTPPTFSTSNVLWSKSMMHCRQLLTPSDQRSRMLQNG